MELDEVIAKFRPPQREAYDLLVTEGRGIIRMRMGLGKSVPTLAAGIKWQTRRWIVVCPNNALNTWKKERNKWFPDQIAEPVIVKGSTVKAKEVLREVFQRGEFYVLTNFSVATRLADFFASYREQVEIVIIDEAQRVENRVTKGFKAIKSLTWDVPHIVILTGNKPTKGPRQLWAFLNILARRTFTSYWKFVTRFHYVTRGFYGMEIGGVRNVPEFNKILRRYMYSVSDEEANKYLPPIFRDSIEVSLTGEQRKVYNDLTAKMIAEVGEDIVIVPSTLARLVRHRQLLVCPKILSPSMGLGAAFEDLLQRLGEIDDPAQRHCVVFTPFKAALPHWEAALKAKGHNKIFRFEGGMDDLEVAAAEESFARSRGEGGIALVSIKFAQSFELDSADYFYFIGYEWDPNDNWQGEGRLRRTRGLENKDKKIIGWYYQHSGTIEDWQMTILEGKASLGNKTLSLGKILSHLD